MTLAGHPPAPPSQPEQAPTSVHGLQRVPEISVISSTSQNEAVSQQLPQSFLPTTSRQANELNHHHNPSQAGPSLWMAAAAQTTLGVRQRMSQASGQLGHSLRQLYTSASNLTDLPPSYHNIPGIVPYYQGRIAGPPPTYDDVINPYAAPPSYQSLFGQMREARKSSRGFLDLLRRLVVILISTIGCTLILATMILLPFTMIILGAIYIDECRIDHIPAFLLVGGLTWAAKNTLHVYNQCQQDPQASLRLEASRDSSTNSQTAASNGASNAEDSRGSPQEQLSATSSEAPLESTILRISSNRLDQQQAELASNILRRRLNTSKHCESVLNCLLLGWFIVGCVIVLRNYEPDFENPNSIRYCHRTVYLYAFWLITSVMFLSSAFIGCICCLMVSSAIASRSEEELT